MTVLKKRKTSKGASNVTKKILILSGSPRKHGNSDLLCDEFMRGALEAGHIVEKIRIQEKKVAYCTACYACRKTGSCAIKDDMAEIMERMISCDVMVLASPVYFYSIDAQLKTVIDRSLCRWREVKNKEMFYIMTSADEENECMDTTLACFRGYASCIGGAVEKGIIYGTGVYHAGEIKETKYMHEAYEMGKNV
ncbi:MAG: flavodoxin family protein [Erysipelotrichaceae bacterium]|nr:flavodoxin family protein [Erysipelotrichaceae bacterium]